MNYDSLLPYTSAVLGGVLAVVALVRPHRTVARWTFAAGMVLLVTESLLNALLGNSDLDPHSLVRLLRWQLMVLALVPGTWLLFSLSYARGDIGKMLNRWRIPIAASLAVPLGIAIWFQEELLTYIDVDGDWSLRLGATGIAMHAFLLIGSVLILMNLERTYRASVGTIRWRIKYMLMGAGILFVVRVYTSSQTLLFRGVDPLIDMVDSGALLLAALFFVRSLQREREFNLDVYPSQSVLQNSLTALLAGVYLLLVGVFAKIVSFFGGDSSFALKALLALVALVLLTLVLQSDKVKLHVRQFVSRHFQRPLYDYRTVWKKSVTGTAACVEQTELCQTLVRLMADIMQALSVSLWVLDDQKETLVLAASTSINRNSETKVDPERAGAVLAYLRAHPEPVKFESSPEPWAETLKQWHPVEFPRGERVCVPITARNEVIGLFILGDRVGSVDFSLQDFEMLQCVCEHSAASLLNVQLSRRLVEAKEFEAFQTMATFFVHDLKNAVSTLNLMLRNLPEHFDDPTFRQDALRGVGKTVGHINNLTGRLGQLRHELKINPQSIDLNAFVTAAVAEFDSKPDLVLLKDFTPVQEVSADAEQLGKVVTNLVLNAIDAMAGKGRIRLATSQNTEWVVLTVRDHGCGMSAEFLSRSLFRPFQTTKQSGLGIGMFQSKMIVEAHGGKIAVASEPGEGTTFQVFLPRH